MKFFNKKLLIYLSTLLLTLIFVKPVLAESSPVGYGVYDEKCAIITGFACDRDFINGPIQVDFWDHTTASGEFLGSTTTTSHWDAASDKHCGDTSGTQHNYGFTFAIPESIKNGAIHKIGVYGINVNGSGGIVGSGNALLRTIQNGVQIPDNKLTIRCEGAANNSFNASLTGPSQGEKSKPLSFSASISTTVNNLSKGEIWVTKKDGTLPAGCPGITTGPWCKISTESISALGIPGKEIAVQGSWAPSAAGSYYVAVNAYDSSGAKCTSNPFDVSSDWQRCGGSSLIELSVASGIDPAISPSNLLVDWQPKGSEIATTMPILTWDNPKDSKSRIDTVAVRVSKNNQANIGDVVEHWFVSSESPSDNNPKTTSGFAKGKAPTSFIMPPGKLENGQTYYWSILIHVDGIWIGSTGYVQGQGGSTVSNDSFKIQAASPAKNIYGANLYSNTQFKYLNITSSQDKINHLNNHLNWAKIALGDGGYVKFYFYGIDNNTSGSLEEWKTLVQGAYDRNLIPVVRLQGPWIKDLNVKPWEGYNAAPPADADGRYTQVAQAYKRVVDSLPKNSSIPLYIELYNEMNYHSENWGNRPTVAQEYPKFFIDAKAAIKSSSPQVKVMIGGLGMSSDVTFLRQMLTVPGFKEVVVADGVLPAHIYPWVNSFGENYNSIPYYQKDHIGGGNVSPLGYKYELEELARNGIDISNVKIIITEGGFFLTKLGGDEGLRAQKTVQFFELLNQDSKWVQGAAFFTLDDFADADVLDLSKPQYDPAKPDSDAGALSWVYPSSSSTELGWPTKRHRVYDEVFLSRMKNFPDAGDEKTISVKVAESPTDLDSAPEQVYDSQSKKIKYTFKDKTPGEKFIFLRFKGSKGTIKDSSTKIMLSDNTQPKVTPTPVMTPTPTPSPTPPAPPATSNPTTSSSSPRGYQVYDDSCSAITGWACDPDFKEGPIRVDFWDQTSTDRTAWKFLDSVTTTYVWDAPSSLSCGLTGNQKYGFTFTIPESIKDGAIHKVGAWGINVGADGSITGSLNYMLKGKQDNQDTTDRKVTVQCSQGAIVSTNEGVNLAVTASSPTPSSGTNKFDLNQDGKVNSMDIGIFFNNWRDDSQNISKFDFNNDNKINTVDFSLLLKNLSK